MFAKYKNRYFVYLAVVAVMFIILVIQLYQLTVVNGEEYAQKVNNTSTQTISVKGSRGAITDINGIVLAYDTVSYDIQFYKNPSDNNSSDRANYTRILQQTISIIEENGGETIDTFMIQRDEEGKYYFDVQSLEESAQVTRVVNWCANMGLVDKPNDEDEDKKNEQYQKLYDQADPEAIYYELREKYRIPEDLAYEDAVKLLSIWQEVQLTSYKAYLPVTIASNVDYNTVAQIEARASDLTGVQVEESSVRVYPKNETASHIIGYEGRITEDELEEKQSQGYAPEDLVGKVGIEATMEQYLTGNSLEKQGEKVIEVDNAGNILDVVSSSPAKNGDNVVLTIDIEMQEMLEEALKDNIEEAHAKQLEVYEANKEKYDEQLNGRDLNMVQSGAAIAMDVKTGDILALVSEPGYDLNLFAGGISEEEYKTLTEDPAKPLFNNAISSTSTPGSIFKMVTAVAGLEEGAITLDERIDCLDEYTEVVNEGATAPECWTDYPQNHANQTVSDAVKNSCNYFFYTVADRLGIEKINKWADKFGLTSATGIELTNEAVGVVGNQQVLYDNTKPLDQQATYDPLLVYRKLIGQLEDFGKEQNVEYTEEQLDAAAQRIMYEAGKGSLVIGAEIRTILSEELDIPENLTTQKNWHGQIVDTVRQLVWKRVDTVLQGIGVKPTLLTPIAVVRYVAALANGGEVLEPHIVDRIVDEEGNIVKETEKVVVNDLDLPESVTNAIKKGMEEVVSAEAGGTAGDAFKNFKYKEYLVGKTGTAPVSDIDLEDNIWLVTYAPKDDPEVALVVFLPHGLSEGVNAYPTVTAFWEYYFDEKQKASGDELPQDDSILGLDGNSSSEPDDVENDGSNNEGE